MLHKKSPNALAIVLWLSVIGLVLGAITATVAKPLTTNNDGIGDGKALIVFGAMAYVVLGLILSFVIGPLLDRLLRNTMLSKYSLAGYQLPVLVTFLIIFWGFVSVVVLGNSTPY